MHGTYLCIPLLHDVEGVQHSMLCLALNRKLYSISVQNPNFKHVCPLQHTDQLYARHAVRNVQRVKPLCKTFADLQKPGKIMPAFFNCPWYRQCLQLVPNPNPQP